MHTELKSYTNEGQVRIHYLDSFFTNLGMGIPFYISYTYYHLNSFQHNKKADFLAADKTCTRTNMEWILAGLTFGFLGSFHCIGMCGPIALSLPRKFPDRPYFIFSRLTYNIGRIITYTVLGVVVGFISSMVSISGYQQGLSIIMGTLLLLTLGWNRLRNLLKNLESLPNKLIAKTTGRIKVLFTNGDLGSLFLIGLLNGFLPCGFVYMALATAVTFGTVESSLLFMVGFGIGTVPAMLGVSLAGGLISATFRRKLQSLSPYFIAIVGIILILRGLNLGIPFISPAL